MTITIVEMDVTNPKLVRLKALTPTTVDVSNGDAYVTMEITLQDDASSISGGIIQYGNSSDQNENYVFNFGAIFATPIFPPPIPSINTANNDPVTYIVRMRVRKFEKPGVMPISMAFDDKMTNFVSLEADQLSAAGFPSAITVVNSGVVDTAPIQLLNFTALSPLVINATTVPTNVTFEIVIQDDVSGFDFGYVADSNFALVYRDFSKNDSFFWETLNHVDPPLPAGVPHTFRLNVALRAGGLQKPGSYLLEVGVTDGVRNTILFNSTQLAARGFPSVIKIVNGTI
jgi:hypothetical protein